ncbi:hypothetical protein SERLA73DRAFT_176882 [Serpula lacrymans var. lacrymans S7.3]|uniref:Nucleolar protein 9 n=2 Tax=Serpula lacrymans var. lacrymans TaxID=341189 RepID=F8PQC9_SERL3|nr:uncharacterized protein SERLADRAFT_460183 [Serpula lacrymans var. lacrymans S7.9]EGO01542.1 hypothetical protein SERLA73DRAFT_176882 [Serpula lacrymans var. lacrymans S7.3]EGO27196.1 hypothetical protein SERLADRAFT_460183 [Serpula lacrymans var. lacrymans S7.9]
MPRENRKRGKKHKKQAEEQDYPAQSQNASHPVENKEPEQNAGPSWIVSGSAQEEINPEAPFGYVDADLKSYFKTVDAQIRNWQEDEFHTEDKNEDIDPNEERRLFFMAALTEMSGKEKQLATDSDCSVILERMAYSMDDFVRRVFIDSLSGSYEKLIQHRFASHVCQTLFTVSADTIARESRGIYPEAPASAEKGELRTLTQLVLDICQELKPSFSSLIMDPFASHVLRALLLVLSPSLLPADSSTTKAQSNLRSKKSVAWKARQGVMKSVFTDEKGKNKVITAQKTPKEFYNAAGDFVRAVREGLGPNEVRALAANKVASPVLQLMLEIEADQGESAVPDSLMDHVLVGMITAYRNDPQASPEVSDYLSTLLRDPTSSHLLETLITRSIEPVFAILWSTYFQGKLSKLAVHPVANFVVAKALERLNGSQLKTALDELEGTWEKVIKSSRAGVLRAVIERAITLRAIEDDVVNAVCAAFGLTDLEQRNLVVPCVLYLMPLQEYLPWSAQKEPAEPQNKANKNPNSKEPNVQGALLLQSLLRLSEPQNQLVIDSIKSLPMEELMKIAHHATSSRILDALFESTTVPFKSKRSFVLSLIGHYHTLVDDRIGSRVGDRCWAFADPYLREKIARSLISYDQFLAASYYGKFFARHLNLYLLQKRPQEWKDLQSQSKAAAAKAPRVSAERPSIHSVKELSNVSTSEDKPKKRKRPERPGDDIDAVFSVFGKKIKRGALKDSPDSLLVERPTEAENPVPNKRTQLIDDDLKAILGAIQAVPKSEKSHKKKGRVH